MKKGKRALIAIALAGLLLAVMLASIGCGASRTRIPWLIADKVTVQNDIEVFETLDTDEIDEYTDGEGVDIDGLTLKDGGIGEDFTVDGDVTATTITMTNFTLGGTAVDATAAEINEVAGIAVSATFQIATETTDTITVTCQLLDGNGDDEVLASTLWGFVSGDSGGVGIVGTAPSGGIAAGTDGTFVAEPVANKLFLAESESDGDLDVVFDEAGDNSFYLVLILPNGRNVVSGEIDFD